MYDEIASYWRSLVDVMQSISSDTLAQVADMLFSCYRRGSTVFVLGNGGSAATASHFACDLAKGTRAPGLPAFRVIPLSDNVPLMTAWANDTSYDRIFAEQLSALVRPDDSATSASILGHAPVKAADNSIPWPISRSWFLQHPLSRSRMRILLSRTASASRCASDSSRNPPYWR